MFIITALKLDSHFRTGVNHVDSTLTVYQRNICLNPLLLFPLELKIDNIGVAIDKQSNKCTVGYKSIEQHYMSNTYTINGLAHSAHCTPIIHAMSTHKLRHQYDKNVMTRITESDTTSKRPWTKTHP